MHVLNTLETSAYEHIEITQNNKIENNVTFMDPFAESSNFQWFPGCGGGHATRLA